MGDLTKILEAMPMMAAAMEKNKGKPSLETRALSYLQEIWPDIKPEEIGAPVSDILEAQAFEGCHESCRGVASCRYHGRKPDASMEQLDGGRRVVVVRYLPCGNKQSAMSDANAARLLIKSRLPERLKNCTFASFQTQGLGDDISKAKGMARTGLDEGNSLVMAGNAGVGKTHLAAAMVLERIKDGKESIFLNIPEWLQELRGEIDGTGGKAFDTVKGAPFLVLDDLGAERGSQWVGERIYMLVNYRYSHNLQTVVTTNRSRPSELAEALGEQGQRVVSRLAQMGTWVHVDGKDFRLMRNGK
jgi:DNA replication protein DnaC